MALCTLVFACFFPVPSPASVIGSAAAVEPVSTAQIRPIETRSTAKRSSSSEMAVPQMTQENNEKQSVSLSFPWNIPVGLAVFHRGDYLWIVFDHSQNIDIEALAANAAPLVDELIQIPNYQGLILRLKPKEGTYYTVRKEGLLWVVDILKRPFPDEEHRYLQAFTQYNSRKQPYLFVPVSNTGNVISTLDPEIGDTIIAAPSLDIGVGIEHPYTYPDLDILASYQGIVIISKTNDIVVSRATTGISIQGYNRGLNISHNLDYLKRQAMLGQDENELSPLTGTISAELMSRPFIEAEQQLRDDIAAAPEEQKNKTRLELAKYYVMRGLGTNALSIINQIKASGAPEAQSERLYGLSGIANFLANRYEQAVEDFSYGHLSTNNEAVFWRTLSEAAIEYKDEYGGILLSFISLIRDYPDEIKDRIALVGAQVALNAGDDLSTQNFIDILKNSRHPGRLVPAVHYLTGKKLVLQGSPMSAINEYRRILPLDSLKYTSLARKEIVELGLKLNLFPLDNAISEFERLRYAWGERTFKLSLLDGLADMYARQKDFANALRTLQELKNYADYEDKPAVDDRMVRLFENIYIHNEADNLPALKSLALYHDYEWLAPKSPQYNTIILKLSDRLVAVDLLDRAESLLTNQLRTVPMTPIDRAKIGTRLALIYLFNHKEGEALLMLDDTQSDAIPQTLALQRKIIRAKALTALNRQEEALKLLKNDYSKNAILLKSEIFWNAGLWGPASDNLKYLVEKPTPGQPLSEEQINYILDWATALKKSGKETVIVRLRNTFMPYFKDTKYHSVFNILTGRLEDDKIDLNSIDRMVNDVAAFSNFTKIYTDSLRLADLDEDTENNGQKNNEQ